LNVDGYQLHKLELINKITQLDSKRIIDDMKLYRSFKSFLDSF